MRNKKRIFSSAEVHALHKLHHCKLTVSSPLVLTCFINNGIDGVVKNMTMTFIVA